MSREGVARTAALVSLVVPSDEMVYCSLPEM